MNSSRNVMLKGGPLDGQVRVVDGDDWREMVRQPSERANAVDVELFGFRIRGVAYNVDEPLEAETHRYKEVRVLKGAEVLGEYAMTPTPPYRLLPVFRHVGKETPYRIF